MLRKSFRSVFRMVIRRVLDKSSVDVTASTGDLLVDGSQILVDSSPIVFS